MTDQSVWLLSVLRYDPHLERRSVLAQSPAAALRGLGQLVADRLDRFAALDEEAVVEAQLLLGGRGRAVLCRLR